MQRRTVIVFTKFPAAGLVKTRLGREIGMTEAAWWYRHQLSQRIRHLHSDPRWRVVIAIAPDIAAHRRHPWDHSLPLWPQGPGDLGTRMMRMLRRAGPGPVVLVGADIPQLRKQHIARAFACLGPNESVLGPSMDGGYWLIGLANGARALPAATLKAVRWSTRFALSDTMFSLGQLSIGLTDCLDDIDTLLDLVAWEAKRKAPDNGFVTPVAPIPE